MQKLEVIVKGPAAIGKSHVMAVIERALSEEYGAEVKIRSHDLRHERNLVGEDIASWQRVDGTKVEIEIKEETVRPENVVRLKMKVTQFPANSNMEYNHRITTILSQTIESLEWFGDEIVVGFKRGVAFSLEECRMLFDPVNRQLQEMRGDIDWNILLYRQDENRNVIQASMLMNPFVRVEYADNELIRIRFSGKIWSNNTFVNEFAKAITRQESLDIRRTIRIDNEWKFRV